MKVNKKKCKPINEYWFQCERELPSGIPEYTYHYKQQSAKPSAVFEIKTTFANEFNDYLLIEQNIKLMEGLVNEFKNINGNKSIQYAISVALSVTLKKCFDKEKYKKTFLNKKSLKPENQEILEELLRFRDKYAAHSDVSRYLKCKTVLLVPPWNKTIKSTGSNPEKAIERYYTISIDIIEKKLPELLQEMNFLVQESIQKSEKLLNDQIRKIKSKNVYRIITGKKIRYEIDDEIFKKLIK